ncbi:growth-blocking peptide, long form-like [Cydia pomonella]|uniref:growth-blocking peptide, long form-like n=1 Tax=Cydia pomonella TaxID=82600 RepID=UPI002ADDC578|nr:growth-blocking peptide, long form-like [Cydia pomonella]
MKLSIIFVCCLISTILYSVEGGLVKDFFGKVKETAEVIHKDVHNVWRPESGNAEKNNTEQTVTTPSAAKDGHDENEDNKEGEHKIITPSSTTVTKEHEAKEDKPEETTTAASETTTKKDERANFSGACQANYRRTADGRCKLVGA